MPYRILYDDDTFTSQGPQDSWPPGLLIVDEIVDDTRRLEELLSVLHYDVRTVQTCNEADEIVEDFDPDVVLIADHLPMTECGPFCKKLQKGGKDGKPLILFLTDGKTVEDRAAGYDLGAIDYIKKPFEHNEVTGRVAAYVELRRSRRVIYQYTHRLEQLLEERNRELMRSERQAIFAQFMQGIVHNLKGPLTVASGNAQLMQLNLKSASGDEPIGDDKLAKLRLSAQKISKAADTLNDMVQSLLAKSRSDQTEDDEVVEFNERVRAEIDFLDADRRFKSKAEKKIRLTDESMKVFMAPGEFSQVFQNIIGNALDAMELEGLEGEFVLEITTRLLDDHAELVIRDNGPGIPEKIIDNVFDPFFTTKQKEKEHNGEEGTPEGPSGTGLGLWMSREAVVRAGGEIEVDNHPEGGARFSIRYPLATRAQIQKEKEKLKNS